MNQEQIEKLHAFKAGLDEQTIEAEGSNVNKETAKSASGRRTLSIAVVSVVAYLIGVPREHYEKAYDPAIYEELEKKEEAKIIRSLCTVRNALMANPGTITNILKYELKNLDSIPDYIDPEIFRYLRAHKIHIVTGKAKNIREYTIIVNNNISNRIGYCKGLFPAWSNFEYLRNVIVMPKGGSDKAVQGCIDKMKERRNCYPYSCYINWPVDKKEMMAENPQTLPDDYSSGNVMLNDRKFLTLLYRVNGDEFTDFHRVVEAGNAIKDTLDDFISANPGITVLVDCENADPYKLCGVLEHIKKASLIGNIKKIILFDDSHCVDAWDVLVDYTNIPIEHEEVERVLNRKSLVDIAMTYGACKERFTQSCKAFIIASSDSDYWGLMRSMRDAEFLVLAEKKQISNETLDFYAKNGITTCIMDDFATNLGQFREGVLKRGLTRRINNILTINFDETLESLYATLRIEMSDKEKSNFRDAVSKKLTISVAGDGEISVGLRE